MAPKWRNLPRLRSEAATHLELLAGDRQTFSVAVESMLALVEENRNLRSVEEASIFLEGQCREFMRMAGGVLTQRGPVLPATPGMTSMRLRVTRKEWKAAGRLAKQVLAKMTILLLALWPDMACAPKQEGSAASYITLDGPVCVERHDDGTTVAHTVHLGLAGGPGIYMLAFHADGVTYNLPLRRLDEPAEAIKARLDAGDTKPWQRLDVVVHTARGDTMAETARHDAVPLCPPDVEEPAGG